MTAAQRDVDFLSVDVDFLSPIRRRPVEQVSLLDRRRERLEVSALGTAIADHPQELFPTRFDSGQPLLLHGTSKPRLRPTAFEVEGHALFHRRVALGTCLRLRHHS